MKGLRVVPLVRNMVVSLLAAFGNLYNYYSDGNINQYDTDAIHI